MTFWVPPTSDTDIVRYTHIASDALDVAREQSWLGFTDDETAVVLLAIASYESGYRADVDSGHIRGDGGRSVCLGQVQVPKSLREKTATNRKECFRTMLDRVATTWAWCAKLPWSERLSGYTVGKCVPSPTSRRYSKRILEGFDGLDSVGIIDEIDDPDRDLVLDN